MVAHLYFLNNVESQAKRMQKTYQADAPKHPTMNRHDTSGKEQRRHNRVAFPAKQHLAGQALTPLYVRISNTGD